MEFASHEKIALLGASRGLGASVHQILADSSHKPELFLASRRLNGMDFSRRELWEKQVDEILKWEPRRVIYFAAGGPYGAFEKFEWKDHEWSWMVSFAFPAYLVHRVLQAQLHEKKNEIRKPSPQVILIGSAVAESKPDPGAAMYCASKHALKGLIESLQLENSELDLRIFSPGYIDTPLLPGNAWPRKKNQVKAAKDVAAELLNFIREPRASVAPRIFLD